MRRLEMVLSAYHTMQISLLTGILFLVYGMLFLEGSLMAIFFFGSGLYLFGGIIFAFLFAILLIAGFKMRKINRETKKIKQALKDLDYYKK